MIRRLYTYWRSTAAYRVRIALNLKELDYEAVPVHLVRDGGEQHRPDYLAINPQALVPSYEDDSGRHSQSLAIVEYLEETHPWPPLLPADPVARARVRALAQIVACDIHPLNNLRVLKYLVGEAGIDEDARQAWYERWVADGFRALEQMLCHDATGEFCHGDAPGLADICLVPQVYNAHRFACDMSPYPTIRRINETCLALPAFDQARPEAQPDAPPAL